jgi:anthranilate phosphoribosyltransferase
VDELIAKVLDGAALDAIEAHRLMSAFMDGELGPVKGAAVITALRIRGETVPEIVGFARAMRERAVRVDAGDDLLDTCGTGGDGANTFNVSTTATFVAAAGGARVAKHGNRAASSLSGAADVLEALGARIDLTPAAIAACIEETGIGFMFAHAHHPAMRHAAPVRSELKVRTVFNLLGPLTNPAGARYHLLGVYAPHLVEPLARVLGELGARRAIVVHGNGLDEATVTGETVYAEWNGERVRAGSFSPGQVGVDAATPESLAGGDPVTNAGIAREILGGAAGPKLEIVALNGGLALYVRGLAETIPAGVEAARRVLSNGAGLAQLERFVQATRRLASQAA